MYRPPRIPLNADERTARRSVPATFVGCVLLPGQRSDFQSQGYAPALNDDLRFLPDF